MTPEVTLLEKVNIHFADAAYEEFKARRYGIKSCKVDKDPLYLNDIREIYSRALELSECDTDQALDTCLGCSLNKIEETVKVL